MGRSRRTAACAGLVAALATLTPATAGSATAPRVTVDVGMVQLSVPRTWVFAQGIPTCSKRSARCTPPCLPGDNDVVYLAMATPGDCKQLVTGPHDDVWISRTKVRPGAARTVAHRGGAIPSVVVRLPSLGDTLYGWGTLGVRIAAAARASGLWTLLHEPLTRVTPAGWRHVSWGHFGVSIPRSWPVVVLPRSDRLEPGTCDAGGFYLPTAFLGTNHLIAACPLIDGNTIEWSAATASNGVWLGGPTWRAVPGPTRTATRSIHGVSVTIAWPVRLYGTGFVVLTLRADGHAMHAELGLGASPAGAAQILSSLRAS